ncbi:hypothetical protein BESB_005300 [Besnoitia besnoiti]|uniref:Maf1 regulator n=1 Tax=Besnoitia besnoiti TaxID=94643 RepID=A0A2A9MJU9_BESBE|nr:hypothetical protein BESB_005300 [Besnoitia besnoiti]PFH38189.1 hypothetical protein BESB_005300 [Besnoitia besnoiti]
MRFLDAPALTRLSALLQHLDVGDRVIRGRLELLSTANQSCVERRILAREIEKELSSSPLFLASSSPPPIVLSSPRWTFGAETLAAGADARGSEAEADAQGEGDAPLSPNSRKKRKTRGSSGSPNSTFSSPVLSCFLLPPRSGSREPGAPAAMSRLSLERRAEDDEKDKRKKDEDEERTTSTSSGSDLDGRRRSSRQKDRAAEGKVSRRERKGSGESNGEGGRGRGGRGSFQELGRAEEGDVRARAKDNSEADDEQSMREEEAEGKEVLVNLIGTLNQCFPDYEFCSALTPAMFEQAARVEDAQAEINRRLCVVERVVPGFLQQLWTAIKESIRLECTDIYFLRVRSSDDPAPLVLYDPRTSSACSSRLASFSASFPASPPTAQPASAPGVCGRGSAGADEARDATVASAGAAEKTEKRGEGAEEKRGRRREPFPVMHRGGHRGKLSRRLPLACFEKSAEGGGRAERATTAGGGQSSADWNTSNSISLFSLSFFFHDRSEEKLLFFTCNCTCKAGGAEDGIAGLEEEEEDDIGDFYVTRAAFGVDDQACGSGGQGGEERDALGDDEDPDTLSDFELPSSACAFA